MRLIDLVELYAHKELIEIDPQWRSVVEKSDEEFEGADGLRKLADIVKWKSPVRKKRKPRPHHFPVLAYSSKLGWFLSLSWQRDGYLQSHTGGEVAWQDVEAAYRLNIGFKSEKLNDLSAGSVFRKAVFKRKHLVFSAIIATLTVNVIALATGLFAMQVYDRVIPRGGFETLWVLTVGVAGAILIDFALRVSRTFLMEHEAADIDLEVSDHFFSRALDVKLDARLDGVGTMAARLKGLQRVRNLMSSGSIFLMADLPFAVMFILVIYWIGGPTLALIPLIVFPVTLLLAVLFGLAIRKDSLKVMTSDNKKNGLLVEAFDGAETIKANYGAWFMRRRWHLLVDSIIDSDKPIKRWTALAQSLFSTIQQSSYIAMVVVGAIAVAQNELTIGALIGCTIIGGRVNGPLMAQLPNFIVQWSSARSSLDMLNQITSLPSDISGDVSLRPEILKGHLQMTNVSFGYSFENQILGVQSLEINPGEKVAIVGGVGSGKSTLLKLLAGLYSPTMGFVTLDGLDMKQIAEDVLRKHVGFLPQNYRLVNGTLRDNLILGLPDKGDHQIIDAAEDTGLINFIGHDGRGLQREIMEGGRGLSGGQCTLTGLTRLMIMQPKLWMLDEPTSSLDSRTESMVMNALERRLEEDSTLLLVTHRTSLLSLVDRVIVMAGGQIIVDGPKEEVMRNMKPLGDRKPTRVDIGANARSLTGRAS